MVQAPGQTTYRHPVVHQPRATPVAAASLIIASAAGVRAVALRPGQPRVIGRSSPADVAIDDRSLSRTHARFELKAGRVHVEDLGSTNGVQVDGEHVPRAFLDDGDRALLGQVEVWISAGSLPVAEPIEGMAEWTARLDHELERARLFGRALSVVALRDAQGPEAGLWTPLDGRLRAVDAACIYAPRVALVLLPEMDTVAAAVWAEAARTDIGAQRLSASVVGFPEAESTAEAMIDLSMRAVRTARPGAQVAQPRSASHPLHHGSADADGAERVDAAGAGPIVVSSCMRELYGLIERIAKAPLPVLVLGETGSGKEHVARAVHDAGPRAGGPFVALNCATIPSTLIESVLFGHEKGAFTGAEKRAEGVFEQADGGSVFLDEVGELSDKAQAALLRVLELKRIVRVGSTQEQEVDVRVVAATHRDLGKMVAEGSFREDLMYRLDALTLNVPPLRERPEEVVPLAHAFLTKARAEWGAAVTGIAPEAVARLEAFPWPGNVRQLKNAVERAAAVCTGDEIGLDDLPEQVVSGVSGIGAVAVSAGATASVPQPARPLAMPSTDSTTDLAARVRAYEEEMIRAALEKTGGNQTRAAAMLGIPRRTLANKVQAYGLGGRG